MTEEKSIIGNLKRVSLTSASVGNSTDDKNIKRHILFTLSNRIRIIKHNYEYLEKEGYLKEMKQIDDDIIPILNSHLNSIYIHLSGGLDNLAWAFCYKSKIFGDIDEYDFNCRSKVGLKKKKFLGAINNSFKELHNFLKEKGNWLQELKELRDPIAHREILLISRIYSEDEAKKKSDLENQIKQKLEDTTQQVIHNVIGEDGVNSFGLQVEKMQDEIDKLGKYYPVFCTTPDSIAILSIKSQIEKDILNFLQITENVLEEIYKL